MFELKTPLLKRTAEDLIGVIDGLKTGTLDRRDAGEITRACNGVRGNVETDLKVRMALGKLNRIEGNPTPLAVAA